MVPDISLTHGHSTSCTQPRHIWVPPLLKKSWTSLVLQSSGCLWWWGDRLEMQGAERQAGFVQSHSVLLAVETAEKKNLRAKSLLYTLAVGAWLVLSHISHSLCRRLTGQRCIKCSAEPEQCNYPPSEARVCAKRFLSSMNELEGEGLLAFMKGRKLQLSNYYFMSQEIWPSWSNVCVINLARQPK